MKIYLTEKIKKIPQFGKTRLAIVSGGLTNRLQLLDLCINRAFKDYLHHHWEMYYFLPTFTFTKEGPDAQSNLY